MLCCCECSSSGRAPPCQGGGSGFEPRHSLQKERHASKRVFFWPLCPDGQMSSSGGTPSIPRPLARKEPLHGTALQMEPAQPGQTYSDRPDPGRCPGLPPARRLLPQPPGHPVRRRAEGPGPPACLFPGLALPGTAQERGQEQHEHRHRALPHRHPSGCAVCGGCQLSVSLHPGAGPGGRLQRPRRHRRDPPDPAQQRGEQPHLRYGGGQLYRGAAVGCGLRHRPAGRLRPHQAGAGRSV